MVCIGVQAMEVLTSIMGPTYIGLQPPPVALCLNLFNIDYRQPQNKWAQNPTACQRLYDETLAIINSKAPNKISAIGVNCKANHVS